MRIAVLVALAVSSACFPTPTTVSGPKFQSVQQRAPDDVTDADLYAATVRVMDDMGLGIRSKDKDAGIVASDFSEAGISGTARVLHAWRVRIEEGLVRIEIECQLSNYNGGGGLTGGGSYSPPYPCSDRRRQVEWTSVAPDFAAKIVADAERRATKRRDREAADEAAKPAAAKPVKLADPEWAKDAKTGGDE